MGWEHATQALRFLASTESRATLSVVAPILFRTTGWVFDMQFLPILEVGPALLQAASGRTYYDSW